MREDVRAQYDCPACGGRSAVTVLGVEVPDALEHHLHRELEEGVSENRLARLTEEKRKTAAATQLRFATCPKCGARHPEGVREARSRARVLVVGGLVFYAGLALMTVRWPAFVLVVPTFSILTIATNLYGHLARDPQRVLRLSAIQLVFVAATILLWWWLPAWAPLVCLACVADTVRSGLGVAGAWFDDGARRMRFDPESTAYRG